MYIHPTKGKHFLTKRWITQLIIFKVNLSAYLLQILEHLFSHRTRCFCDSSNFKRLFLLCTTKMVVLRSMNIFTYSNTTTHSTAWYFSVHFYCDHCFLLMFFFEPYFWHQLFRSRSTLTPTFMMEAWQGWPVMNQIQIVKWNWLPSTKHHIHASVATMDMWWTGDLSWRLSSGQDISQVKFSGLSKW